VGIEGRWCRMEVIAMEIDILRLRRSDFGEWAHGCCFGAVHRGEAGPEKLILPARGDISKVEIVEAIRGVSGDVGESRRESCRVALRGRG